MAGVVRIPWYATVFRQELVRRRRSRRSPRWRSATAPPQYSVHRSRDDRYRITQMAWFESKTDWYRYWDGPEMIEFRRRNTSHYQIPMTYIWNDELVAGALGPPGSRRARARAGARTQSPHRRAGLEELARAAGCSDRDACSPQRHLQPEALVRVVERVAEQLAQAGQPVARGLRVDAQPLGDRARAGPARPATPLSVSVKRPRDPGGSSASGARRSAASSPRQPRSLPQQQLAGALAGDDQRRARPRRAAVRRGRGRS